MKRHKLNQHRARRFFSRTATAIRKKNMIMPMRGGFRI